MSGRTITVGDIHGCALALRTIFRKIDPQVNDLFVLLGDFIDRGPDTRGVLEQLVTLSKRCRVVALLGNHEEMMLAARRDVANFEPWVFFGGAATLASYGAGGLEQLPAEHLALIEACVPYYETDTHLFLHANYIPNLPLSRQPPSVLRWESLGDRLPERHISGKTALVGHTPQRMGTMLDLGYLKCLDTFCYGGGWLTALDVERGNIWQANEQGTRRRLESAGGPQ